MGTKKKNPLETFCFARNPNNHILPSIIIPSMKILPASSKPCRGKRIHIHEAQERLNIPCETEWRVTEAGRNLWDLPVQPPTTPVTPKPYLQVPHPDASQTLPEPVTAPWPWTTYSDASTLFQ